MSDVSPRYLVAVLGESHPLQRGADLGGGGRNFLSLWARSPLYEFFPRKSDYIHGGVRTFLPSPSVAMCPFGLQLWGGFLFLFFSCS